MAGLTRQTPNPTSIVVHQRSRVLEIHFDDGTGAKLSFEFLRVHSPSAEVRGHGPGQEILQTGKRDVAIESVDAVGHYAIQPRFSDGHVSGIYSWDYLHELVRDHDRLWQAYLDRLAAAGQDRGPPAGSAPAMAPASPPASAAMKSTEIKRRS